MKWTGKGDAFEVENARQNTHIPLQNLSPIGALIKERNRRMVHFKVFQQSI